MNGLSQPPPFAASSARGSASTAWSTWKKSFDYYVQASQITDGGVKRALLLHSAGLEVQQLFDTLPDTGTTYEQAVSALTTHFEPQTNVAYDIACQLTAHLKKSRQAELLEKVKFVVPAFHAYGHKTSCQREYNIRNIDGMGLTDGEATERLWAYLRRFSSMTKEMTPLGREEKLTSALLHFAYRKQAKIAGTLCAAMKRATNTQEKCQQEFLELRNEYAVTEEDVKQWQASRTAQQ